MNIGWHFEIVSSSICMRRLTNFLQKVSASKIESMEIPVKISREILRLCYFAESTSKHCSKQLFPSVVHLKTFVRLSPVKLTVSIDVNSWISLGAIAYDVAESAAAALLFLTGCTYAIRKFSFRSTAVNEFGHTLSLMELLTWRKITPASNGKYLSTTLSVFAESTSRYFSARRTIILLYLLFSINWSL